MLNLFSFLVILAFTISSASIVELDSTSFQSLVLNSKDLWIVRLQDDAMPDSVLLDLEEKLISYDFKLGSINCQEKVNKKLCRDVPGVPIYKVFQDLPVMNPYTKKLNRIVRTFP